MMKLNRMMNEYNQLFIQMIKLKDEGKPIPEELQKKIDLFESVITHVENNKLLEEK